MTGNESHRRGALERLLQQRHRGPGPSFERVGGAERARDKRREERDALHPREHEALLERRDRLVDVSTDHIDDSAAEERLETAVGVVAGGRDLRAFLGDIHGFVELAELGEGPREPRARPHRGERGHVESLVHEAALERGDDLAQ